MYTGSGFSSFELGDVDVVYDNGLFHLFHLVIPNHDYIAHATSRNGLEWKRVQNALFIGEPGEWDDDMLWTMHLSRDPERLNGWRMFYTGIARREKGRIQRVGMARSKDLLSWEKDRSGSYPLSIEGPHYENNLIEGRGWVSCRDPFFYQEGKVRIILVSARMSRGPVIRRGCVGVAREVEPDKYTWLPPLYYPRMYDDVEVPNILKIQDVYYLFGGIREDVRVHYWYSSSLFGEYKSFFDNTLLPNGNYAARIKKMEDGRILLWNFFVNDQDPIPVRLLPPPKEVVLAPDGHLFLMSYRDFDRVVKKTIHLPAECSVNTLLDNPSASSCIEGNKIQLKSGSGYEIFAIQHAVSNFRMSYRIKMSGRGKTGIFFRGDEQTNGYYIKLDLMKGMANIFIWGKNEMGIFDNSFLYKHLQGSAFSVNKERCYDVQLICYGGYIELSIGGRVMLSLIDIQYIQKEIVGFYIESADIWLENLKIDLLDGPKDEEYGPLL